MGIWGFKGGVISCYYYDRLRFLGRALVIDCYNSIPWQRIVHLIAQENTIWRCHVYWCPSLPCRNNFVISAQFIVITSSLCYVERVKCLLLKNGYHLLFSRFVRRGFSECLIESIPEKKREKINLSRNSKYYMKKLVPDTSGITLHRAVIWNITAWKIIHLY